MAMKRIMVRYKVKPEMAAENRRLVEAVFATTKAQQFEGIRYATFVAQDGVSFVHAFSNERADGSNPLGESAAFKAFQANVRDRCVEPPQATEYETIGSYRMFD
jgi:quinol monooxygenase YgiN